jgi:hypothetical protein
MLQLNPFPLKQQKDHFAGSFKFLHHPQPPCNIFGLTLHNKIGNPGKIICYKIVIWKL